MKKIILSALFLVFTMTSVVWAEEGAMKTYFPNGKVQMETSSAGMKTYYENGQIMSEIDFKDGNAVGVGKTYYEDGKIMREDNYDTKQWKQFFPDGNLQAEGSM